ncbi:MAG: hypothetical protein V4757_06610 [Pseudomonadota bacterium]
MATTATPAKTAPKAPKAPKVEKHLIDRIDEQLGKAVLQKKVTLEDLQKLQTRVTRFITFLEA